MLRPRAGPQRRHGRTVGVVDAGATQHRPGATAALKVTALVSPASHHPLELQLIHENLAGARHALLVHGVQRRHPGPVKLLVLTGAAPWRAGMPSPPYATARIALGSAIGRAPPPPLQTQT
jgi:hypothetical protein